MASARVHVNVRTPRVRVTDIPQRVVSGPDAEELADDGSFCARHAVLEKAERQANKSVYCTAQYRQAVDRARQRQKEEAKARYKLLPGSSLTSATKPGELDDCSAADAEAGKGSGYRRKRSRAGRGILDGVCRPSHLRTNIGCQLLAALSRCRIHMNPVVVMLCTRLNRASLRAILGSRYQARPGCKQSHSNSCKRILD